MSRNRRKGATSRPTPPQLSEIVREDEDDASSVMSVDSMGNTSVAESLTDVQEEDGMPTTAESKLITFIDLCSEKGAATRVKGLEGIRKVLQQSVILFDSDWSHSQTICDILERSLKRGKAGEQQLAARNFLLFVLQNEGGILESEHLNEVMTLLRVMLNDSSTPASVRCACISTFAVLTFMRSTMMVAEIDGSMRLLEELFRGSFLKGDGSVAKLNPGLIDVHLAALKGWLLLLVIAHRSQFRRVRKDVLTHLPEILTSSNVDLRITAGEAIALVYERFRELEEDESVDMADLEYLLNIPKFTEMIASLEELGKDGAKNRAKADRRKQRSSFRDIISSVRDGDSITPERIRFGKEELTLSDWSGRRIYESFCDVVSGGMTQHLKENPIIRDIFDLGPPIVIAAGEKPPKGLSRHERHLANQAIAKERFTRRSQHRDKRFVY